MNILFWLDNWNLSFGERIIYGNVSNINAKVAELNRNNHWSWHLIASRNIMIKNRTIIS